MPWNGHMAVVNMTQACNELPDMVDRIQNGERIAITSKNCNAVLMSETEYNSLMETLHLPSDPDMAADLYRTRRTPLSESGIARIHSDPGSAGTQRLRGAEEKGLRPEGNG